MSTSTQTLSLKSRFKSHQLTTVIYNVHRHIHIRITQIHIYSCQDDDNDTPGQSTIRNILGVLCSNCYNYWADKSHFSRLVHTKYQRRICVYCRRARVEKAIHQMIWKINYEDLELRYGLRKIMVGIYTVLFHIRIIIELPVYPILKWIPTYLPAQYRQLYWLALELTLHHLYLLYWIKYLYLPTSAISLTIHV